MNDWLQRSLQSLMDFLGAQFSALLDALNPLTWVVPAAEQFAQFLPYPNDVAAIMAPMVAGVKVASKYISLVDFFVNVPFLMMCVALMFTVEGGLLVVRAWKFVRSFLT